MTARIRKTHLAPRFERIVLIGTGGTGSYLAQGLAKLVAGYGLSLDVMLVDPDTIEEKNCSRQNFHPCEIGQPKAEALAFRLNQLYGTSFGAVKALGGPYIGSSTDKTRLVITCVDNITSRKELKHCGPWLDLGNGLDNGQAIYGCSIMVGDSSAEICNWDKTPHVGRLPSPYLVAAMGNLKDKKKKAPSCADTPFAEQGIFANEWAAAAGLCILHQLLIKGELATPAIYFDTRGRMTPEYITKEYLQR